MQSRIKETLGIQLKCLLQTIADEYDIEYDELVKFVESVNGETTGCLYKFTRGEQKGKYCHKRTMGNGYCSKHQTTAIKTNTSIPKKTRETETTPGKITKTQAQIIEWLNTAVPQDETVLKRRSKGLWHEESDILFDEDYTAIGRLDKDKIVPLSPFEVEMCERRGWAYHEDAIESDVE